jgi:hypothetical protein
MLQVTPHTVMTQPTPTTRDTIITQLRIILPADWYVIESSQECYTQAWGSDTDEQEALEDLSTRINDANVGIIANCTRVHDSMMRLTLKNITSESLTMLQAALMTSPRASIL